MRARELRQTSPDAERAMWQALRNHQLNGYNFRRQHPVGHRFADFACVEARLIVELDGGQHFEPGAMESDHRRTDELHRAGFSVLRFTDREVLTERDDVLAQILDWLYIHHPHPHPNPLPQAGEGVNPLPFVGEGVNTTKD